MESEVVIKERERATLSPLRHTPVSIGLIGSLKPLFNRLRLFCLITSALAEQEEPERPTKLGTNLRDEMRG